MTFKAPNVDDRVIFHQAEGDTPIDGRKAHPATVTYVHRLFAAEGLINIAFSRGNGITVRREVVRHRSQLAGDWCYWEWPE